MARGDYHIEYHPKASTMNEDLVSFGRNFNLLLSLVILKRLEDPYRPACQIIEANQRQVTYRTGSSHLILRSIRND